MALHGDNCMEDGNSSDPGTREPPPKRGVASIGGGDPITKAEHKSLFDEFQAKITTKFQGIVQDSNDKVQAATLAGCKELFDKQSFQFEARLNERIAPVEANIHALQAENASLKKGQTNLVERVAAMESSMAKAEAQPNSVVDLLNEEEFCRDAVLSCLEVNAKEPVANLSVKAAISPWLEGAGFTEKNWTFTGPAFGRRFSLLFSGDSLTGARRAKKANLALRRDDGSWETIHVENANGQSVPLFVGPDKSPQTTARETLGKKLLHVVQEMHPGMDFFFDKKQFLVRVKSPGSTLKKDLAVMVAESKDTRFPKFGPPLSASLASTKMPSSQRCKAIPMAIWTRMTPIGPPNKILNPFRPPHAAPYLKVLSWNARGLFHGDVRKLRAKVNYLGEIAKDCCVIHVQEAHGSKAYIEKFLQLLSRRFWIYDSLLRNELAGVLTLVSKQWVPSQSSISFEAKVPGRVARVCIEGDNMKHIFWNAHNYGIPENVLSQVVRTIHGDYECAKINPFACCVFVSGDFNFPAVPGQKFSFANPLHANSATNFSNNFLNGASSDSIAIWNSVLTRFTEVVQPCPTHFWPANTTETRSLSTSTILERRS